MATRTRIATLVHLSDLHFAVPSVEEGALPPTIWRHWSRFDGFLGHHRDALIHLTSFMHEIRRMDGQVHVVVTGDLTAVGKAEEFERATQFLQSSGTMGLGMPDALSRCIPGNHDHWPGSRRIIGRAVALDTTIPVRPMTPVRIDLPKDRKLVLLGINTDEDVWHSGLDRLRGTGVFVSQLIALKEQLAPPTPDEIRVLMLHHSPQHRGRILGISKKSRRLLQETLKRMGVSVILTGHLHTPQGQVVPLSDRGKVWSLLEARCGTTTQVDRVPPNWVAAGTNSPDRLPENTLIVHRLFDTDAQTHWECELHVRVHDGFRPVGMLPGLYGSPLVVWPR
jgi:3',5'-cyclic AMP phosphodiesterase CpdA